MIVDISLYAEWQSCTLLYTISKLLAYYASFHQWTSLSYKSSNIHVKSTCYSQIWQNFGGDEYLCKLGKEYLNASLCKYVVYSLQHSETFDVSHVFLPFTIAELSTLKQVRFFWPTLYLFSLSILHCYANCQGFADWCGYLRTSIP